MYYARIVGHATATVKHPSMEGSRLLLVMALQADGRTPEGDPILAKRRVAEEKRGLRGRRLTKNKGGKKESKRKQGSYGVHSCHRWWVRFGILTRTGLGMVCQHMLRRRGNKCFQKSDESPEDICGSSGRAGTC